MIFTYKYNFKCKEYKNCIRNISIYTENTKMFYIYLHKNSSKCSAFTCLLLLEEDIVFPILNMYGITLSICTCPIKPAKNNSSRIPDSIALNGGKHSSNLQIK